MDNIRGFSLLETHAIANRPQTLRSRVTNGSQLLAGIDGRTAPARRYGIYASRLPTTSAAPRA